MSSTSSDPLFLISSERETLGRNDACERSRDSIWSLDMMKRVYFLNDAVQQQFLRALDTPSSGAPRNSLLAFENNSQHALQRLEIRYLGKTETTLLYLMALKELRIRRLDAAYAKTGYGLTRAEIECLDLMVSGVTDVANIATHRGVSPNTCKKQVSSIIAKFGVADKSSLLAHVLKDQNLVH